MKYLEEYWVSFLLSVAGIFCILAYFYNGSHVDENGFVIEQFGFIPLFWIFEVLALIVFFITLTKNKLNKSKTR